MWDEVQFLFIRWDGQMMNYYETNKLHRLLGENKEDRWDIKTDYNNEYQITLTMKEPVYSTNIEKYIKKVEWNTEGIHLFIWLLPISESDPSNSN